jgi:drug/metabolite transporter (DMT)-like permease
MDAPRGLVIAAFTIVYVIWGSTYLAIKVSLETLPPFAIASVRFLIAGALLYAIARARGDAPPERRHWPGLALVGGLLLLGGNGGVMWAQQHVPSGLASVVIAMVPIFVAIFDAFGEKGTRPSPAMIAGVALGFGGIALLVLGGRGLPGSIAPIGALALLGSACSWALGSVCSRRVALPPSLLIATAGQMLCGGALQGVASLTTGEWARVDLGAASWRSLLAIAYLVVFGSLVAFSAYVWLLRVVAPTRVATYAYVNPVVALLLGWLLAGEQLTGLTLGAAALTIAGVVVIVTARASTKQEPVIEPAPETSAPARTGT